MGTCQTHKGLCPVWLPLRLPCPLLYWRKHGARLRCSALKGGIEASAADHRFWSPTLVHHIWYTYMCGLWLFGPYFATSFLSGFAFLWTV